MVVMTDICGLALAAICRHAGMFVPEMLILGFGFFPRNDAKSYRTPVDVRQKQKQKHDFL